MFDNFSEESRIWIYGFNKNLSDDEVKIVDMALKAFTNSWLYHGKTVHGDYVIIENRFVVMITNDSISGCSIDSSVAAFKELKQNHGLDALNQGLIFYRDEGFIKSLNRLEFNNLVQSDKISEDSIVFNLMITSLEELNSGKFELPFKESWHFKAFIKKEIAA